MKTTKRLLSLLLVVAVIMQLCVGAIATGGNTNLTAEISATTATVGDTITLTISNKEMTAEGIKAGFYFDNTKLERGIHLKERISLFIGRDFPISFYL